MRQLKENLLHLDSSMQQPVRRIQVGGGNCDDRIMDVYYIYETEEKSKSEELKILMEKIVGFSLQ